MAEAGEQEENETLLLDQRSAIQLVEELRRSNAALRSETEMLERHLQRLESRPPAGQTETASPVEGPHVDTAAVGHGRKFKAWMAAEERLQRLTVEQKCEVAQKELEEMRGDLDRLKASSQRVLTNYRATSEEADIHLAEIKKASHEFDHVAKAFREKSGTLMGAEKVIRYFDHKMRAKDALVEKLRLKNAALKVQKRKLQMQLKEKEELDEALHEVDFQQLKIENSQYLERIDECNQDLLGCKLTAGKALELLNSHKKKLQNTMDEMRSLSRDIAARRETLAKISAETVQAEKERSKAEALNQRFRSQLAKYHVPHILEYITAKTTHNELEQNVRTWERKVEISEMVLKTHTKAWKKLRMSAVVAPVVTH